MSAVAQPARPSQSDTRVARRNQWQRELDDAIRGASGGFLFGIPLLYTMEIWWLGSFTTPPRMLGALLFTFGVLLLLNRTAGFRRSHHLGWRDAVLDSVEALAIGLLCTTLILGLLHEISISAPLDVILGKTVFEAIPFSLGVALANQFLGGNDEPAEPDDAQQPADSLHATAADVGATLIGAVIIAFNIAPTDEVPTLAAAIPPPGYLALIAASLLISYAIVFAANFSDQRGRRRQQGICQHPWSETLLSYIVSLLAAAFMLWFLQRLGSSDPWQLWLSHTIVLGLPATVGGAAGRLAL